MGTGLCCTAPSLDLYMAAQAHIRCADWGAGPGVSCPQRVEPKEAIGPIWKAGQKCCVSPDHSFEVAFLFMDYFAVGHLSVERLLQDWRWLCPQRLSLVARNAFGDLFLQDDAGKIMWLDVAAGRLTHVADSWKSFRDYTATEEMQERWFAVKDETQAASRGLVPGAEQCIGFATPLVFAESGYAENPYVADLYDHVSFLGDVHRQLVELPDGAKVKLVIKE